MGFTLPENNVKGYYAETNKRKPDVKGWLSFYLFIT